MTEISDLSAEVMELILSYLPIPKLIKVSTVCKLWYSIISSPSFPNHHHNQPWLILHGFDEFYPLNKKTQTFAFDPSSNSWFLLPIIPTPDGHPRQLQTVAFFGTDGLVFTTYPEFLYTSIFDPIWHATAPLHSPRYKPLFVSNDGCKFIVFGGKRNLDTKVFDVQIYDPLSDCWELAPPLPEKLISEDLRGNLSTSCLKSILSTTLFKGKLYVLGKSHGSLCSLDLDQRVWSDVITLYPPWVRVRKYFLIAGREHLILVGNCYLTHETFIKLWKVDEKATVFIEISVMPHDLYRSLFVDKEARYPCFNCVGMGNLVYVFNQLETFVCEISSEPGKCVWRRVPQMPRMIYEGFCSTVSLHSIMGVREHSCGFREAGHSSIS